MKKQFSKITVCALVGAMVFSNAPVAAEASTSAGVSGYTAEMLTATVLPTAGVSLAFSQCMADTKEALILASAQPEVTENDAPVVADEYVQLAVATVNDYVNIRSEASEEAEIVGKLYDKCVATVEAEENGWYKISSGKANGYVKAEFVTVGDEELLKSVGQRMATVLCETLRVRKSADIDSEIIELVPEADDLVVVDESIDGWVGVSTENGEGYVSSEFVSLDTVYKYAESKAEEEARLAREEAERVAAQEAANNATKSSSSSSSSSSSKSSGKKYANPTGSSGQDVVNYATQFVGNPYVYGGSSLTKGTDCSGFVMSVYKAFGISLPHSSKSLRSCGTSVSLSNAQPGDIVCYSGHVAIYMGGGKIVHASNKRDGIKISSSVNYRNVLSVRRIL